MSTEQCKLCNQDSTPWVHINGHICQDCYANTKRLWSSEKMSWISVNDRLPSESECILVANVNLKYEEKVAICAFYDENKFFYDSSHDSGEWEEIKGVTHWMPLPEPPNA